ncbi:MAG: TlyA family rRNA (cytidine-2'-O)-methyltransferase [Chloroflexota bacterium]
MGKTRHLPTGATPRETGRTRKRPLAALLVEQGLFATEDEVRRWVMAGQVLVDGQRVDKPGTPVDHDAALGVRGRHRYVSRGGYKLAAALVHFAVSPAGRVALDSGASTGGFTDCLLQHGAALVYAVEVGYGQLAGRLRADQRVVNKERTNLGDLDRTRLQPAPTLIALDLSYLSLTAALPLAAALLDAPGDVLALVKPLFEVQDANAGRTGQIADPSLIVAALRRVLEAGGGADLVPVGIAKLALRPRHGVAEYVAHFTSAPAGTPISYSDEALCALVSGPGMGPEEIVDPTHP